MNFQHNLLILIELKSNLQISLNLQTENLLKISL